GPPPERIWYSNGGIRHVRGWPIALTLPAPDFEGDLVGTGTFIQHSDWNSEGTGSVSGPFTVEVEWQGINGTFTTQFAGNVQNYHLSGTFVAHGSGGFEGLKWQATVEGFINGPYTYGGRILDPKGE
nr:hypothetical protein [candidate division KSB1 bacterium]NIR68356.1 hypothetical protein [candidate division KSB1 bacterium]NIS22541.1 hypothetical protein [candidate division KSB1 bacterium]NIT69377.1 hypothetical protein [candidate division KSB1 bacterium]NIU23038.1 hypothetical protein [candidate division KSB1 bacterium]